MIHNFKNYNKLNENKNNINHLIDYTSLKTNTTVDDIKQLVEDAIKNHYHSICILPQFVSTAKAFIDNEPLKLCTVISFPNGDHKTNHKVQDTIKAITEGVDEIDMVMDYKQLKKMSNNDDDYQKTYEDITDDIKSVIKKCHSEGIVLKVIIEVEELSYNEIKNACDICVSAGVDFIQTSTGMAKTQKSFDDKLEKIKYMVKILPDFIKIKAAGGIRTEEQINQLLPFVDRIGTSVKINDIVE